MASDSEPDRLPPTDTQIAIAKLRRDTCDPCNQCSDRTKDVVTCHASRRVALSYLYDRCPLRKWVGRRDEMPSRPRPAPAPPEWLQYPPVPHEQHITSNNRSDCPVSELFVYGFPGMYAGANTELHHQILLWRSIGIGVHLIPGGHRYRDEPLFRPMIDLGVKIHEQDDFSAISPGAPVLGFCNGGFLEKIDQIHRYSHNTVFVNCMTWLFELEKQRVREGKLAALLYQNDTVRMKSEEVLRALNPDPKIQFISFQPYFADELFPWVDQREESVVTLGRISRHDADKYSASTLAIWSAVSSPVPKRGLMLGFGETSEMKIGLPPKWINTFADQSEISQQEFYRQCDIILQPSDTTENWPRVGLEAMASGSVLIVDNRGGWRQMVDHGVTGWLCDDDDDFVRFGTRMATNRDERRAMALAARIRLLQIAGEPASGHSWRSVLKKLNLLASKVHS